MSSDVVANPQTVGAGESKSARKKKAKADAAATAVPALERPASELGASSSDPATKANGVDSGENVYIKELQKNIRGVTKKLTSTQKIDAIIEANPGVSLDQLVSSRKINSDQKAAALKKPALQAQLAQLEEQIAQYRKIDQEYQHKIAQEKEILQQSHSTEIEKLRQTLKAEAALEHKKAFREKFLTLSRFLRAAAARRQLEEDDSDLTKAFEGALLLVYGGDASAVAAVEKLIDGSNDSVPSTEGVTLSVSYGQIKQAALEEAPFAAEEEWVENVAQAQPDAPESETPTAGSTDPTIANAGLTEITTGVASLNGGLQTDSSSAPAAASVDTGAANAAAEEQWDKQQSGSDDPLAESFEMVPRDPAETESPAAAAPISSTQSWADDTPDPATTSSAAAPTNPDDGFSQVPPRGGRGRGGPPDGGRGHFRGRGQRGDGRGRGGYGRGRGRGGDFRGGPRGSFRGPRGGDAQ